MCVGVVVAPPTVAPLNGDFCFGGLCGDRELCVDCVCGLFVDCVCVIWEGVDYVCVDIVIVSHTITLN